MLDINTLEKIKKEFFQGSLDYTKNQPDFFLPHKYKSIAPSTVNRFLGEFKESIGDDKNVLIYVHLPFCFSECVFCNSFPHRADKEPQALYFKNIVKEIELFASSGLLDGKQVQSIYFGGGTPTSFSNENLGVILNTIKERMNVVAGASITTEAHPSTLKNPDRIQGLAGIGINRVSIGCQTFDPEILKICNRSHTRESIKKIITTLNELDMLNNIDMMAGLPGQTIDSMKRDMEILEDINPVAVEYIRHEIVNPLAIEIYKKDPGLIVKDEELFKMVHLMQSWMQSRGYEQNGYFTHKKFWEYRYHWLEEVPIIAFGSRARSYSKSMSYDKHEDMAIYNGLLKKGVLPVGRYIPFSKRDQMYRSLFMRLQLKQGLCLDAFAERFNENGLAVFRGLIKDLKRFDCIQITDTHICLTQIGAFFVEDVCDYIIDYALKLESNDLKRNPNSLGSTSARL